MKQDSIWQQLVFISWYWAPTISWVQLLSRVQLFSTQWTAARQASLSITNSWSFFKLMSIELVMLSNHLILCHPLLLPSIFPSIRVISNESTLCIRWPKYWSFSFSNSPSNEYSGLISFRIDWSDLLSVQGTLKSPLDSKEIQQVHPKRNHSWMFIGRTDVEAETPVLWSLDAKN